MKNALLLIAALFAGLALVPGAVAQDQAQPSAASAKAPKPEHFYKVVFVVEELGADGKPVNSRSYTATVSTGEYSSDRIRTGSKVPIPTAISQSSNGAPTISQFQYQEVGINFDIHDVHEVGQQLALRINADVSNMVPASDPKFPEPVIRHNQWDSPVLLPIDKATPIFTSDNIDNKGALQVVARATRLE